MQPMEKLFGIPMMPVQAAAHADNIDLLIVFIHWFMLALGLFWGGFFLYTLWRFRASAHPKADYLGLRSHFSQYLEIGVVLVEVVLLVGFSIPLYAKWTDEYPDEKESVVVRVVAEQFAWNFHYPGKDGKFGRTRADLVNIQTNPLGLDPSDPSGRDDFVTSILHLQKDKPTIAHISSKDVIHNLGIPALRVKQDAVPGISIPNSFTPTREGKYLIACSQLCGNGHSLMRGFVEVHPKERFESWYEGQVAQALLSRGGAAAALAHQD